jgi:hypothetical protein
MQSRNLRVALCVAVLASGAISARTARAQCPFNPPTNDVPRDVEAGVALLYLGKLGVFNVYWGDDWDAKPGNFKQADIENAMKEVIGTQYFDRLCQYGVPGFQWEGKASSGGLFNPCPHDPGATTSTFDILDFMSCEEYTPFTGVPPSTGLPNPVTCAVCGSAPINCFDPIATTVLLGGDPVAGAAAAEACVATPNPTADRIYVLFLPKGTVINDFGRLSCSSYGAYHFQIPSRGLFIPSPPFILTGTQGRPVNIAIIPTDCFSSIRSMMSAVTHELVDAATDPLPLAHWLDESTEPRPTSIRLDPSNIETLLRMGEIADICGTSQTFTASDGSQIDVADYWSNHDNMCVSLDTTPPSVQIISRPADPTNQTTADFAFTAADPDNDPSQLALTCSLDGGAAAECSSMAASFSGLTAGSHTFTVSASDLAGNVGSSSYGWRVDLTPPTVTLTSAPDNPSNQGTASFTFDVADADDNLPELTVACTLDGSTPIGCGALTATYAGLTEGTHSFAVTATDRAGNVGEASFSWLVEMTPPVTSTVIELGPGTTPNPRYNGRKSSQALRFDANGNILGNCSYWTAGPIVVRPPRYGVMTQACIWDRAGNLLDNTWPCANVEWCYLASAYPPPPPLLWVLRYNAAGVGVGFRYLGEKSSPYVIWSSVQAVRAELDGTITDLTDPAWFLRYALDIDDSGAIVGIGRDWGDRGFLLLP